jgi:CHAT domain-containing protein
MEWLWDVIAAPVLDDLSITGPSTGGRITRVWWCPTGLLSLLPLHGAGYHASDDGRTVLDRVVSSYTTTLRALGETQRRRPAAEGGMLFVGVPDAADLVQLRGEVARERAVVEAALPNGITVVEGTDATTTTVAAALAAHRWVHISCHGYQDLRDPSRAGLLLKDGTLTIPRIGAGRYAGEFAFLSACMTATGGLDLADEAITLAAALSYTGYRHVIATLWSVHPATAARVAELVYARLSSGGTFRPDEAAVALHEAVRALRDGGTRIDDWLPFTHTGP